MAAEAATTHRTSFPPVAQAARPVTISYSDLKDRDKDLSGKIGEAFGPDGLGIVLVSDVPNFPLLRKNLLSLAWRVANLPDNAKKELEDPESRYSFGWTHGTQNYETGKPDSFKASFYANPLMDSTTDDAALIHRYPAYC